MSYEKIEKYCDISSFNAVAPAVLLFVGLPLFLFFEWNYAIENGITVISATTVIFLWHRVNMLSTHLSALNCRTKPLETKKTP